MAAGQTPTDAAVSVAAGALSILGRELLELDDLSAPLFPLSALIYFVTLLVTLRTKMKRFSFAGALVSASLTLATVACRIPWGIIGLLSAGTVLPYLELRSRRQPTRVYVLHMALFAGLLVVGQYFSDREGSQRVHTLWAILPLLGGVLIRSGIVPFHTWLTDLFDRATFGTALLFVTPLLGAYAAVRLVVPIAPDWVLRSMGSVSLVTAVYAAGLAMVQTEARRFFCFLFLSHASLVLVGLETVTAIGLTGGLCVWISVGLGLTGFGLTLRALESRHGHVYFDDFHGLYDHMPTLAVYYVLTGLACVGFPGTLGFIGTELLVDGAVAAYPLTGVAVIVAAALNSISVIKTYFILFTGTRHLTSISLISRQRERAAVLVMAALILLGGLFPQPGVASRYRVAERLLEERVKSAGDRPAEETSPHALFWNDAAGEGESRTH
ncbi:MAG: proton-conducting transporter membrane subunit [Planctomycetaceae bacterium]